MKSKILKSINKDINKSIKPDKTNKLSNICIVINNVLSQNLNVSCRPTKESIKYDLIVGLIP